MRTSSPGCSSRVSSTPAIGGVPALCAASEPTTRSARSPGVTTRQPGVRAVRKFGSIAPPKTKPRASRASPESSPSRTFASMRLGDLGHGRRGQGGLVRDDVAGHGQPRPEPLGDLVPVGAGDPVGDHGEHVAAQVLVGPIGVARLGEHRLGGLLASAHDGYDARAELVGEPGVEGQLVRELGVGEVGAEDEHELVVAGDGVEPVDERGDQLVRPALGLEGGRLVVVHAVDRRWLLGEAVAGAQQLEQTVGDVVDQRPEHPHPVDLPGQELHHSQFDYLAAVAAVDAGHVHAARHACSPFRLASVVGGRKIAQ